MDSLLHCKSIKDFKGFKESWESFPIPPPLILGGLCLQIPSPGNVMTTISISTPQSITLYSFLLLLFVYIYLSSSRLSIYATRTLLVNFSHIHIQQKSLQRPLVTLHGKNPNSISGNFKLLTLYPLLSFTPRHCRSLDLMSPA